MLFYINAETEHFWNTYLLGNMKCIVDNVETIK